MNGKLLLKAVILGQLSLTGLHATLVQFSSFFSYNGDTVYNYTNNDSLSSALGTLNANSDVYFIFYTSNVPAYALKQALPSGPIHATLVRNSSSSSPATCSNTSGTVPCNNGTTVSQPIGVGSIVFYVFGTSQVLFKIDGAKNNISGTIGGTTGGFSASSGASSFSFSSDFIDFSKTDQLDRSITLSTIVDTDTATTGLNVNANGLLNSFTAQASGNFSAEFVQTPEPSTLAMVFGGGLLIAIWTGRLRRSH